MFFLHIKDIQLLNHSAAITLEEFNTGPSLPYNPQAQFDFYGNNSGPQVAFGCFQSAISLPHSFLNFYDLVLLEDHRTVLL